MFRDRQDAGRRLAVQLRSEAIDPAGPPVVVGLARGGLPVAAEVAKGLGAPLDVLVARKLGVPWQPELGMGAIAEGGAEVLNRRLIGELGLDEASISAVRAREQHELARRVERYRRGRPPIAVEDRTVILIDDGLATGYTAWAGIEALRRRGARRVVLATPVAPPETVAALSRVADAVVAIHQPELFMAIGEFYEDFSQTSDEEVIRLLSPGRLAS